MADDKKSFSRRRLLRFSAAAGVTAILGEPVSFAGTQQSGPRTPVPAPADELVFMNGKIHTMDRNNTVVQTVSIKNGRFSTVGGAVPRKGPGIRIIDLRGRTVVPGIIDNHNHVVLMGNRPGYHTPLENAYSIREVQEIVAARAKGIPSGGWITTNSVLYADRYLRNRRLSGFPLRAARSGQPHGPLVKDLVRPTSAGTVDRSDRSHLGVQSLSRSRVAGGIAGERKATAADSGAIVAGGEHAKPVQRNREECKAVQDRRAAAEQRPVTTQHARARVLGAGGSAGEPRGSRRTSSIAATSLNRKRSEGPRATIARGIPCRERSINANLQHHSAESLCSQHKIGLIDPKNQSPGREAFGR